MEGHWDFRLEGRVSGRGLRVGVLLEVSGRCVEGEEEGGK